jgi:hypothetical protein
MNFSYSTPPRSTTRSLPINSIELEDTSNEKKLSFPNTDIISDYEDIKNNKTSSSPTSITQLSSEPSPPSFRLVGPKFQIGISNLKLITL